MMIPAASYLRASTEKQDTSVTDQRSSVTVEAKKAGFRIVKEYVDDGISGDSTEKRTAFRRMLHDAAGGTFKAVLCWDSDRFGRFDILEAGHWIKPLRDAGIYLHTVNEGRIDWSDFAGRMLYSIKQEGKHAFLRDLSRNVNRGMLAAARDGKSYNAPFGYRLANDSLEPDPERAHIVKRLFRDYLAGHSTNGLARALNQEGVAPLRAKAWNAATIRQILMRRAYLGTHIWNSSTKAKYSRVKNGEVISVQKRGHWKNDPEDMVVIENHHPALIDRKTFDAVQKMLVANRISNSPLGPRGAFALSGLLICGACGAKMHGRQRDYGDRALFYVCSTSLHQPGKCRTNSVAQAILIESIVEQISEDMLSPERIKAHEKSIREKLAREKRADQLASLRSRLATIDGKIVKAKRRLVECDADMLHVVQDALRTMVDEQATLTQEITSAGLTASQAIDQFRQQIANISNEIRNLKKMANKAPSGDLRVCLARLIERVVVHVETVRLGPRRMISRFKTIEIKHKS